MIAANRIFSVCIADVTEVPYFKLRSTLSSKNCNSSFAAGVSFVASVRVVRMLLLLSIEHFFLSKKNSCSHLKRVSESEKFQHFFGLFDFSETRTGPMFQWYLTYYKL